MKKLSLSIALGLLSFSFACGGSGSGSGGFGGGGDTANGKLKGQYAYQLTGVDFNNTTATPFFREAGVFTADGNGNITSGVDDFSESSQSSLNSAFTGTYTISTDGTGTAVFNFGTSGSASYALTVVSSSKVDLIETDTVATAGGTAQLQTASSFAAAPTGTFVFRLHTFGASLGSSVSEVGAFTVASGAITGTADTNTGGSVSTVSVTGLFNAPDATTGRGAGSINDSVNGTTAFNYYMIDSNTIQLFASQPGTMGLGRAEIQTAGPYNAASITGGYAFGSRGDTATVDAVRTVGQFTADGSGNITGGATDSAQDGVSSSVTLTTGTYSVQSNGRATVALTSSTGTVNDIFWMVSPSRAFFLVDDSAKQEDGTADLQSGAFSKSTVNGTYVFLTDGYTLTTGDTYDRVGTLTADGSGTLVVKYALNFDGSSSLVTLNGTYDVTANGRMTGSVNTLSSNLVFYLVSGSQAYMLQNDTGFELDGAMSKQQ